MSPSKRSLVALLVGAVVLPIAVPTVATAGPSPAFVPAVGSEPVPPILASGFEPLVPVRVVDTREELGGTSLRAGVGQRIQITGSGGISVGAVAMSANFTVTETQRSGYLTVWDCAPERPVVATLNFGAGETVPNAASAPLDSNGGICVFSTADTHLVVDVNGLYRSQAAGRFSSITPIRLMDTRVPFGPSGRVHDGGTVELQVAGAHGLPADIGAVALNVASVDAAQRGFITAYPCDAPRPFTASLNPVPGQVKPNLVMTSLSADGRVCLYSSTPVDLVVDATGYFSSVAEAKFTSSPPFRFTDTRERSRVDVNGGTGGAALAAGQVLKIHVAGERGIPASASALSANIAATGADKPGFVTAFPCGARPNTANVNYTTVTAISNGAQLSLSPDGHLCIYAYTSVHVIIDVNGWWSIPPSPVRTTTAPDATTTTTAPVTTLPTPPPTDPTTAVAPTESKGRPTTKSPTGTTTTTTTVPDTSSTTTTPGATDATGTATGTTTTSIPSSGVGYPTTPPAPICGNASILNGPTIAPAGAVSVSTSQNLNDLTNASPAGTTFWLAAGTHTLGSTIYGQVIPKSGNTYIGAPGAVLDGQGVNRYAFTQTALNVTIKNLTIRGFGGYRANMNEGVVNHDAATGWLIERNTITANGGAGVFVGSDNIVRQNCLKDNGQYGFSMYKPQLAGGASAITNIVIQQNEIAGNNTDDWEALYPDCGCTGGGKFWDVSGATIIDNWVHHNRSVGLWADTNDIGFRFEGNYINDNDAEGIFYEISYNALIKNNTFIRNALVKGRKFAARSDSFPVAALYLSEAGGDPRLNGGVYSTLEVVGNLFHDNWNGVTIWENADRYCGSAANTSGTYCTIVNPAATLTTCADPNLVAAAPYLSDCRWKSKNILIHNNDFRIDKTAIACTTAYCGLNSMLSNWGTFPTWSPYKGRIVQDAITYTQNNRFTNNRYVGDWKFNPYEMSRLISLVTWQAAPYNQDAGSTG